MQSIDLEDQLEGTVAGSTEDLLVLLDRTVAALTRAGSAEAVQAVLQHGKKQQPRLGAPFGRLAALASTDLSRHADVLKELLDTLNRSLPGRLFGLVQFKRRDHVLPLIRALSGTPDGVVIERLSEIAKRYPGENFGQLADETVQALRARSDPKRTSAPGLMGDLDLFGLSGLLQTLAGSEHTGVLTLMDQDTETVGVLTLTAGKISSARAGELENRTAVYQLFERPATGTFMFRRRRGQEFQDLSSLPP